MNPLFLQAPELARKLTRLHYCDQAVEELLSYMDPTVTWFGCGEAEFSLHYDEIVGYFKRAPGVIPRCEIWDEEYYLTAKLEDSCIVAGRFRVRTNEASKMLLEVHQRITYVFRVIDGALKVIHLHASNPYGDLKTGEVFPAAVGKSTYDYLNRVIQKKTEQIEVMLGAMTGGLKGSRDDEVYSYFYVSDKLCAMLGYTKEEFMAASGGSAVGAVYPPDLTSALEQCSECFKRGENYAAEYRMQKKDGSLIWVLDSGRKMHNDEGKIVINSIILNITDKKRADEEIIKQKNFLQSLYNTMLSGLVQLTVEDAPRILNANRMAVELLGYVQAEGKSGDIDLFSLVYPQDVDYVRRVFNRLRAQAGSLRYEHRIVTQSGKVLWLDVNGEKLRNVEGTEVFQLIFTDISEKKAVELNMKREWERYRLVAQNGADVIFEYEPEEDRFSYYLQSGDAAEKTQKNVICPYRKNIYLREIVADEDIPKVLAIVCEGRLESAEVRMVKDWDWAHIQGTAVRDGKGKIIRVVGTMRDISDIKQKELEYVELQQRFTLALRNSYKEVFEVNLHNDEFYLMNFSEMGFSRNKVEQGFRKTFDWSVVNIIHPEDKERFHNFCMAALDHAEVLRDGKEIYCECRQKEEDRRYYWRLYMLRRADWDDNTMLFFVRDIDRVKREAEQTQRMLKEAVLAAEAGNRAKSDFLSRMSHDIRTPMNAIVGMTSIAKLSLEQPQKVMDCLSNIGVASAFLLALINDILDMARIESGKLELVCKPFVFGDVVDDLANLVEMQAQEKKLHFEVVMEAELKAVYLGDTLRLHQVFMNLLSNAVKFTESGGSIRFSIRRLSGNGCSDLLEFVVSDTGIGMDEIFLQHIFDPFEQANKSGARNYGGSGLGLSIAENLVRMMGGTIRVTSELGRGTTFIVELPLSCEVAANQEQDIVRQTAKSPKVYDFRGRRILLVEDNEINREIATTILEMEEMIVDTARDGQEAVDKFASSASGSYDLILMDIRMPNKDGLAATAEIRTMLHPDAVRIPIVAMTANVFKEDMDKAKASGMNGYVIKPVDTGILYDVIDRLLCRAAIAPGVWIE